MTRVIINTVSLGLFGHFKSMRLIVKSINYQVDCINYQTCHLIIGMVDG
jgi:hypothetical protein